MLDYDTEMELYAAKLDEMVRLMGAVDKMKSGDQRFASDLINTFNTGHALSVKQWEWVSKLADRVEALEPVYGDFDAIRVMFQIAGEHIKFPKIRLVASDDRFVQLNFFPDTKTIKVFVDGWQGHGYRKYAGEIVDNVIHPYSADRMTEAVKSVIQELSLDPMGVAKAMAQKLGVCSFCGQRLSDPESKGRGYGPVCADHYGLAWGKNNWAKLEKGTKLKAV